MIREETDLDLTEELDALPDVGRESLENIRMLSGQTLQLVLNQIQIQTPNKTNQVKKRRENKKDHQPKTKP